MLSKLWWIRNTIINFIAHTFWFLLLVTVEYHCYHYSSVLQWLIMINHEASAFPVERRVQIVLFSQDELEISGCGTARLNAAQCSTISSQCTWENSGFVVRTSQQCLAQRCRSCCYGECWCSCQSALGIFCAVHLCRLIGIVLHSLFWLNERDARMLMVANHSHKQSASLFSCVIWCSEWLSSAILPILIHSAF